MRIRDIGYGLLILTVSAAIGLCVSQMGRFTSAAGIVSDVKATHDNVNQEESFHSWEGRTLYIGELRGCGLRDYARIAGTDYFCVSEMTVFNVWEKRLSDENFTQRTLESLLAEREYDCVVVALGLNEAGYPMEQLRQGFEVLVDKLIKTQPQAKIVLQGVLTVGYDQAAKVPYTAPKRLELINNMLQKIAGECRVKYVNANEEFADSQGYLPDEMSADGCYLYPEYYCLWAQWLREKME